MSWSPNLRPRPRTVGLWHPTKTFNPLGDTGGHARSSRQASTTRTTRTRATRGRTVPQDRAR